MARVPTGSEQSPYEDASAWRGAARRSARLQLAQLVVVLLFGLIVVATTIGVTRAADASRDAQRTQQETLGQMVALRSELQNQNNLFWFDRAQGRTHASQTALLFAVTGPALVRALVARDERERTDGRDTGTRVIAASDRLSALVLALPADLKPNTPADDAFLREAVPALSELLAASEEMVASKQRAVDAATRKASSTSHAWTTALYLLLGVVSLLTMLIWHRLARARSRLVTALEGAAERLESRSKIDQLTGLTGHATFQQSLSAEVRATDHGVRAPLALALFDLDHFKEINDTFGHQTGDDILREIGRLFAEAAAPEDIVGRVGGEEFAWLMPGKDALSAYAVADRLRMMIERAPIREVRVTISSGVCDLAPGIGAADLYRRTDEALRWAKAHGRNITFRYTPEMLEELSASERAERLERARAITTVRALARAVDAKDPTTQRHSERVGDLARAIALELGWSRLRALRLHEAALVHDVGKIGVPDAILFKPALLDPHERSLVEAHAALGAQIVSGVVSEEQGEWIRSHHERMDGAGYPDRLAGEEIPEGARILALADACDAMASARPYSDPLPVPEVLRRCREERGRQFWGPAVDALERLVADGRAPGLELDEEPPADRLTPAIPAKSTTDR